MQRRKCFCFSTLLFAVGAALLVSPGVQNTTIETVGLWLIVVAALVRKGIMPFHAWVPEVFDHGRLGPVILFNAPQVGAYLTVVLIVPRASPEMLRTIALLALGTTVYGAALALVARLWSALMLARMGQGVEVAPRRRVRLRSMPQILRGSPRGSSLGGRARVRR